MRPHPLRFEFCLPLSTKRKLSAPRPAPPSPLPHRPQLYNFMRRRRSELLDWALLYRFLADGATAVASALFSILFVVSLYWIVFFKLQGTAYTVVPANTETAALVFPLVLTVAVILQTAYMCEILRQQVNTDVFFIDWENARETLAPGGGKQRAPVSVWRLLFVANEWNEMASLRLTSLPLTLLLLVLILRGLSVENLATVQPDGTDLVLHSYSSVSFVLRFGVAAFLFVSLAFLQILWKLLIHHRYISNPATNFIDFLSLSNVSIFVMTDRFSGYYLHGRALMPYSDVTLSDLTAEMRKEQEGSVGTRGLVPGGARPALAENQCFEMFVTPELRAKYEEALLQYVEAARLRARERDGLRAGFARAELADDQMLRGSDELGSIFRHFIQQVEAAPGGIVQEKSQLARFLGTPPDMGVIRDPVFYHDLGYAWKRLTFFGIEHVLLLFNVLIFTAVDMAIQHSPTAAFITFLLDRVFVIARDYFGQLNLERKSLVDGRFLL